MTEYISKSALVAEIERRYETNLIGAHSAFKNGKIEALREVKDFLDTLEVKEVEIFIPNIDDTLKEEGIDPYSKEAKVFKESYYMALEKLKSQKGESV